MGITIDASEENDDRDGVDDDGVVGRIGADVLLGCNISEFVESSLVLLKLLVDDDDGFFVVVEGNDI